MSEFPTVELLSYSGSDTAHALAAWTSTSRELTDEKRARIPQLLKQLADQSHGTPFEHSHVSFLITCDTASHIQLLRHRHWSFNVESARYRRLVDKDHFPVDWPEYLKGELQEHTEAGRALYRHLYDELIKAGLTKTRAKESARYALGYNSCVHITASANFRCLMDFLKLRLDPHAQLEIRSIAAQMLELVRGTGAFDASLAAFGYGSTEEVKGP